MKILVGIKRVVDYNVRVRVLSDGSGVDTDGVKMSVNPFDENPPRMSPQAPAKQITLKSCVGESPQSLIIRPRIMSLSVRVCNCWTVKRRER